MPPGAANGAAVVTEIEARTGVRIEVISGEEESRLAYLAAQSALETKAGSLVVLDTGVSVDDHSDFRLDGLPNVISAGSWMTPRTNLGVQTALIAHARHFLGTCGGLAWLAPFMGVPTEAVYADDSLLLPHMLVARQAGRKVGAAEFCPVDLRAWNRLGMAPDRAGQPVGDAN